MKRRNFLHLLGKGTLLPIALNGLSVKAYGTQSPFLSMLAGVPCNDRILVLIQLAGGNDGLNTVIPLDQYSNYLNARPTIAVSESSALKLNTATGLHPQMTAMHNLFNAGKLRVIQSVGYPTPDFSHFRSTDIWMTGSDSDKVIETGWLGRWLDTEYPGFPKGYPSSYMPDPVAIQIGSVVATATEGPTANMSMAFTNPNTYYNIVNYGDATNKNTRFLQELAFVRQTGLQIQQFATPVKAAAARVTTQSAQYPPANSNPLADQLKIVAQLIAGGLKTRVYIVSQGGYDTHSNQLNGGNGTVYSHPTLLNQLSVAVAAFQDDLQFLRVDQKVVGMTFSEFGRRIQQNASAGTDHGAAAPLFVFGTNVLQGVLGSNPTIPSNVTLNDNIPMQFDFRSVYATLLRDWLCVPQTKVKELLYTDFPYLPIINSSTASDVDERGNLVNTQLVACSPNPAIGNVTLRIQTDGTPLRLSLFDHTGREISVLLEQTLSPGEHRMNYDTSTLSSGNYYWRVQTSRRSQTSAMVVVK